ncbi:Rad1-domain-containing protein [Patellaria atrata CBS 101060]|uniref:Rad1-domain-containing protein n=1 Tax=Patellaria atrata CBS 101060 TaxID=1346257 RepID=A0A9P4SB64_9PEZI|nr:Rad1-domain-containing protein [Patellaria atrata CBS 101060]
MVDKDIPVFTAVSSSARQLFILLRCLNFATKAQVQISAEGLRISAEESSSMEAFAFLEKELFESFQFNPPASPDDAESLSSNHSADIPIFEISLPALLETLQIFGIANPQQPRDSNNNSISSTSRNATNAFDSRVLGMTGICRLTYAGTGSPFSIIMSEANVTTTCDLTSYEPSTIEDIPFARDKLAQKIIMSGSWLYDAMRELESTSPEQLSITASPDPPTFTLSASGTLGSAIVEFSNNKELLETFQVGRKVRNTYRFALLKKAARTMQAAVKVSIRVDDQGVLSMQFMIEVEKGVSFVDFRFVPLIGEEAGGNGDVNADEETDGYHDDDDDEGDDENSEMLEG